MKHVRPLLRSGATVWLALGFVLALGLPSGGQEAARPGRAGCAAALRTGVALASRGHPNLALIEPGPVVASYAVAVGSPAQRPEDSPSDLSSAQTGDTPAAEEQGQDALATERQGRDAPAAAEPGPDAGSGGPALTVERRGRLLVLTYGAGTAGGALAAGANPRKETPGFVVFQGLRPIAVGKFEYGWGGACSYSWRVPITTFGNLKIAATPRDGVVSPFVGKPVTYYWPWYRHLARLGPWALLALAVGLPRRNRDRRALLIFVPLAILGLLWPAVAPRVNLSSDSADQFALLFESLVVGLALLWLRADTSARLPGPARVAVNLGLLVLAGFVTLLSAGRTTSDPLFTILLIYMVVMGALLLAALALTRRITHRRYVPLRFSLWLALWTILLMALTTALAALVMQLVITRGSVDPRFFLTVTLVGGVLGLCLYAVNLPYLLLMFSSDFFRRRFQVWLGVGSLSSSDGAANPEGLYSGRHE